MRTVLSMDCFSPMYPFFRNSSITRSNSFCKCFSGINWPALIRPLSFLSWINALMIFEKTFESGSSCFSSKSEIAIGLDKPEVIGIKTIWRDFYLSKSSHSEKRVSLTFSRNFAWKNNEWSCSSVTISLWIADTSDWTTSDGKLNFWLISRK